MKTDVLLRLNWDWAALSAATGIAYARLVGALSDGRVLNYLVSAYIASNSTLDRHSDGRSGYLFCEGGHYYRLRIGTEQLSLSASGNKGMGRSYSPSRQEMEMKDRGFLIAFTEELPNCNIYILTQEHVAQLREAGLLNDRFEGDAPAVLAHIKQPELAL